ncbi:hypothetical protein [Kribbella sp. NPDC049227]|uniref:hypothetical protein n=1 Tax=Kribbella sp. NPDC049227 TaxID=3364113 RepID=UPI00371349BB
MGPTFAYGCFLVRRCPSNWNVPTPPATSQQLVTVMVNNITDWVGRGTITPPDDTAAAARVAIPQQQLPVENER